MKKIIILLLTASILSISGLELEAATTKFWRLDQSAEFLEGKFEGTGLTLDGRVKPTLLADRDTLPVNLIWEVAQNDYGMLAGTSRPAALYWLEKGEKPEKIVERDGVGFTALTASDDLLYAGFSPGGEIYYGRRGDEIERKEELGANLILTMLPDEAGGIYIGTGDPGKIFQMTATGQVEVVAQVKDQAVMSLTKMDNSLYLGTDQGTLYRQQLGGADTTPEPIYNFPDREIRSMQSEAGALYLGINKFADGGGAGLAEAMGGVSSQIPEQLLQQLEAGHGPPMEELPVDVEEVEVLPPEELPGEEIGAPEFIPEAEELSPETVEQREAGEELEEQQEIEFDLRRLLEEDGNETAEKMFGDRLGSILVKFRPPDKMVLLTESQEMTIFDLLVEEGEVYLATGGEGKIYKIDEQGDEMLYFSTEQAQVTNLLSGPEGELSRFTTANGAVIFSRRSFEAGVATYLSPIFDAQLLSQWGQFETYDQGTVEYRTRAGITEKPGENWSDWSEWQDETPFNIASPPARFVQFEARFNRWDAVLRRVEIARRASNQPPRIEKFSVSPDPRQEILFEDGQRRDDLRRGGGQALAQLMRAFRQEGEDRQRLLEWQAVDLDNDLLSYTLYYRSYGAQNWINLAGPDKLAEENEYVWDPREFADGRYEFKLHVSDRLSNPPEEAKHVSRVIGPVTVDNSPPVISDFEHDAGRVSFTASDNISRIVTAYYRCNGSDWRRLRSTDGLLDSRTESFSFSLPRSAEESEIIELLIVDSSGNRRINKFFLE